MNLVIRRQYISYDLLYDIDIWNWLITLLNKSFEDVYTFWALVAWFWVSQVKYYIVHERKIQNSRNFEWEFWIFSCLIDLMKTIFVYICESTFKGNKKYSRIFSIKYLQLTHFYFIAMYKIFIFRIDICMCAT